MYWDDRAQAIRNLGLDKLDGDPDERLDDLELVLDFLNGKRSQADARDMDRIIRRWSKKSSPGPNLNDHDRGMWAADEVLGGHGIEALFDDGSDELSTHSGSTVMEYVNVGEAYAPTVVYDFDDEEAYIGSWGDYVEGWEQGRAEEEMEEEGGEGFIFHGVTMTDDLPLDDPRWVRSVFHLRNPQDIEDFQDLVGYMNGTRFSRAWAKAIETRHGRVDHDDAIQWSMGVLNKMLGGRGVVEVEDGQGFSYVAVELQTDQDTTVLYQLDQPGGVVIGSFEDLERPDRGIEFV